MVVSKRQVVLPILLLGSLAGPGTSAAQAPTASASVTAAKSSAEQPAGLSLQQLVDEALRQSPAVGAASAGVEVARESVRFARTERLPRFDFSTGYDYLGPQGQLPMRGAVFDLSQLSGFRYNPSLFRFGVGFSVPVYSGGRIEATIGREEAGKGIADERLRLSKEELIEQVAATFYRILQLAEEIKAAEGSLASLRESQRILREQVEVGTAARVELLKVNTRVAAIEQALIQVHNGQEIARTQLSSLIGRERVANKVQVAGVLAYEPKPGELSQHLDLAIRQRPELRTQELAVSAERQTVKIARAGLLPTLSVNGLAETLRGTASSTFGQETVFAGLSIPIFSGQDYAATARARVRVKEEEEQLRRLRLRIDSEVEEAYLNLNSAEQRIRAAETVRTEAAEVLRIEQLKLSVGKGVVQDTLDAQAAALEAENNYSRAVADANIAWVRLARATGTVETLRW